MATQSLRQPLRASKVNIHTRRIKSGIVSGLAVLATIIVIAPLVAILLYLLKQGVTSLNWDFFTKIPVPAGESGGGMENAIVGSGVVLALASLIGIPLGIGAGIYLAEYAGSTRMGNLVRFTADVLNGVPSIVMGIAIYALIVLPQKHFSAFAGGVVLGVMMVPTVTRTTEEMLRMVPHAIREAALGLGVPAWRSVLTITVRTATELPDDVVAAYDAPFPNVESKAGAAQFPILVPAAEDAVGAAEMRALANALSRWQKPALVAFSDLDRIFPYPKAGQVFCDLIPTAMEQVKIEGAAHFLQEDRGERLAEEVLKHLT